MAFDIEMTGAQDYQRTIKMALAGFPGTGKTLTASTAPQVFFVFFRDQPRIMSIAERYIPHTKITNKYDDYGRLVTPVWETFHEVIDYMDSERGKVYETFVIDTGDELQQAMKEGKKAQNRGKWAIQDWGWLADMYREVIGRAIDLPKHVIVTYHLKNTQEGEDGEIVRELALQGAAKDEAPGWFDIVGVIDSWEEDTEKGKIPHRGILTSTTPKYPFVKDHSGKLPKLWEISDNFVGDFARIHELVYANVPTSDHEIIETIEAEPKPEPPKAKTKAETGGVPTPTEVKKKKASKAKEQPKEEVKDEEPEVEAAPVEAKPVEPAPVEDPVPDTPDGPEGKTETETDSSGDLPAEEEPPTDGSGPVVTTEEAVENVEAGLPGAEIVEATCEAVTEDGEVCGVPLVKEKTTPTGEVLTDSDGNAYLVPDRDLMDLTMIRFRKHMCRDHFKQARNA